MEYPLAVVELAQTELADLAQGACYSNDYIRLKRITRISEAISELDRYIRFLEFKINNND